MEEGEERMTILALFSNKGGVGKTAATVNLAYLAAQSGRSTLICDLDPQGSTTFYFRIKPKLKRKARGLPQQPKPIERSIKGTDYDGLELLPADFSHRNLDITFAGQKRSRRRLAMVLKPLCQEYDLIVLDCPPTINIVAENVIFAADHLLVPLVPTTLCVRTYEQLLTFTNEQGRDVAMLSPFLSMVDARKKLHRELSADLPGQIDGLLASTIPYRSKVEQMGLYREPLPAFAPSDGASRAYQALWAEIDQELLT
jgi:cellulose biosynthesis protein BcsQ